MAGSEWRSRGGVSVVCQTSCRFVRHDEIENVRMLALCTDREKALNNVRCLLLPNTALVVLILAMRRTRVQ
jgi:hypothetical protein